VLKPCQRPIPDQGRVLLDNIVNFLTEIYRALQKNIGYFKKYRNIPKRISGAANKYRIHAGILGLLQLFEQVPGALPHAPRSPRGRGAGRPAIKSSLHPWS
jgi:hypothetical protein